MVALDVVRTMQLKINRIMAGKLKSIEAVPTRDLRLIVLAKI